MATDAIYIPLPNNTVAAFLTSLEFCMITIVTLCTNFIIKRLVSYKKINVHDTRRRTSTTRVKYVVNFLL